MEKNGWKSGNWSNGPGTVTDKSEVKNSSWNDQTRKPAKNTAVEEWNVNAGGWDMDSGGWDLTGNKAEIPNNILTVVPSTTVGTDNSSIAAVAATDIVTATTASASGGGGGEKKENISSVRKKQA